MDSDVKDRLNAFIASKGLRRTGQREIIAKEVFSGDDHFTADELYDRLRRTADDISRATVYRTLALFVEAELLREIDLGEDRKTYDPNYLDKPSHNHLVCIDCRRVVEFEDPHVDLLNDCVTRRLGFRTVRQTIKIEANCEQLRTTGRCSSLIASRLTGKRLKKKK